MLECSMQVAVVEAVGIGLVNEAKGAAVGHDDFGTCHPFFHPPGCGRAKQFIRILRGFLSCQEKANTPFFELFHTEAPF